MAQEKLLDWIMTKLNNTVEQLMAWHNVDSKEKFLFMSCSDNNQGECQVCCTRKAFSSYADDCMVGTNIDYANVPVQLYSNKLPTIGGCRRTDDGQQENGTTIKMVFGGIEIWWGLGQFCFIQDKYNSSRISDRTKHF